MDNLKYNLVFKSKLGEDVYHFEILIRNENDFYPQLAGYIIINLKTETSKKSINIGSTTMLNAEVLHLDALAAARGIKKLIEGQEDVIFNA